MKRTLVCGAGGFIGNHLVSSLKAQGHWVTGADLHSPEFDTSAADQFYITDLRDAANVDTLIADGYDEVYQLAADMGGAGFVFVGANDWDIMTNSTAINLNILQALRKYSVPRVFFASSACVYPEHNQLDPDNPDCREHTAYPAAPDSEYGWEKLYAERMYQSAQRCWGLVIRIARFHNVYGPGSVFRGGREKAPAALCRKILESDGTVEIWGDGQQTRSFLYIDQAIEGIHRLMASQWDQPLNIGSDRAISIRNLAAMIAGIAGRDTEFLFRPGPQGVAGRNSDNTLCNTVLGWAPDSDLETGLAATLDWIRHRL